MTINTGVRGAVAALAVAGAVCASADHEEAMAMRWWNALDGDQMVAALHGADATAEEDAAARMMYADLDAATKAHVDAAAAELYGRGGHDSVGAWWETLDCRLMRVAAGDGNAADPLSLYCAHYPGSGAGRLLGPGPLAHVDMVGMALLGRDDAGVYPPYSATAMGWWNTLDGDQMVAALHGDTATPRQDHYARMPYGDLDAETRGMVNRATADIYGDGGFASVGIWWETLDCRRMRVAAGDGNTADPMSPYCAHYPRSGLSTILGEAQTAHVDKVGMGLLRRTSPGGYPAAYHVPLVPANSMMPDRQGVVRIVNRGPRAADVRITAWDDAGMPHGPVVVPVESGAAVHYGAADLEMETGQGEGHWRLVLWSRLPIKATGHVLGGDGAMNSLAGTVRRTAAGYLVDLFDATGGVLRIVNPGHATAYVHIKGTDDAGMASGGHVSLAVPGRSSRMLDAMTLETGGEGLDGALGDGMGNWRLRVDAPQRIVVMSLIADAATGRLVNVSASTNR